jgi:hypothetical protein
LYVNIPFYHGGGSFNSGYSFLRNERLGGISSKGGIILLWDRSANDVSIRPENRKTGDGTPTPPVSMPGLYKIQFLISLFWPFPQWGHDLGPKIIVHYFLGQGGTGARDNFSSGHKNRWDDSFGLFGVMAREKGRGGWRGLRKDPW